MSVVIREVLSEWGLESIPDDDSWSVIAEIARRLPDECKVRVEAATPNGYHTFCFDCDGTMCENEVEYPDDPDWDGLYEREAREYLMAHPELEVERYMLWGSTRRYIRVYALPQNPEREDDYHAFDIPGGRQIRVDYSSVQRINRMGPQAANVILPLFRQLPAPQDSLAVTR